MAWSGTSRSQRFLLGIGVLSIMVFGCADEDLSGAVAAPKVSASASASVPPATPTPVAVHYICDGGKTFDAYVFPVPAQRAIVVVDGRTLDLPQTISASGIRYSDGTLVYHSKGRDAFIEVSGVMTYVNCVGDKP